MTRMLRLPRPRHRKHSPENPDEAFLEHMKEVDAKRARDYQKDLALEDGDNYPALLIQQCQESRWLKGVDHHAV